MAAAKRAVLASESLGCESHKISQHFLSLCVKSREQKQLLPFKVLLVLPVLVLLRVVLASGGLLAGCWAEKGLVTATSMASPLPSHQVLDRHVSRASARGRAQDALLLEHWREHALIGDIRNPCCEEHCCGGVMRSPVFAQQVAWSPLGVDMGCVHEGQGISLVRCGDAETVQHRSAEVVRAHNGLVSVFLGRALRSQTRSHWG